MPHLDFSSHIPIDIPHTLKQLLNRFRSVRHGLPELLKNSKDQYLRKSVVDRVDRQIVILASSTAGRLAVIDFAGACKTDFDAWKTWSDRRANRRDISQDIEGGNGNGGKGFMCNGSRSLATIESACEGRFNRMAFDNADEDHVFNPAVAFDANNQRLREVSESSPVNRLNEALSPFGVSIADLPRGVQAAFENRNTYTLVQLEDVVDWYRKPREEVLRRIAEIPQDLGVHPQAALTLELCEVHLVVDGKSLSNVISTVQQEPLEGFANLDAIPVPAHLTDPQTQEVVDTGPGDDSTKALKLSTSAQSLRMEETRPLNVIRVSNGRNVVANWSVADLFSRAESAYIYGRLELPLFLDPEHLAGADRESLADTPLVRAVRHWTSEQVQALSERIQQATAQEHTADDREKANSQLDRLRDLMRTFLDTDRAGGIGQGEGGPGEGEGDEGARVGNRVDLLVLENNAECVALANGSVVPVVVRAFQVEPNGKRLPVSNPAIDFYAEHADVVSFSDGLLHGLRAGTTKIWFGATGTTVTSNIVTAESVSCSGVEITDAPERPLLQGERVPLRITFHVDTIKRTDLLVDAATDETNMGTVSRHGVYTAGRREGGVTVRVKFGPGNESTAAVKMTVGPERVPRRDPRPRQIDGTGNSSDLPYVLLCGTPVPGTEDRPAQFRTIAASSHEPTIIDFEPEFENVVFINPDSKEASQVRAGRGGRRGMAGIGTKTFGQFLALKCYEILKRLKVFQENAGSSLDPHQIRQAFALAEQQCASFIEHAYALGQEMAAEHERQQDG
jgi:hypothetical protein